MELTHAPGRDPATEELRAALAARKQMAAHLLEYYMSARAEQVAANLADTVQRHSQDLAAGRALPYAPAPRDTRIAHKNTDGDDVFATTQPRLTVGASSSSSTTAAASHETESPAVKRKRARASTAPAVKKEREAPAMTDDDIFGTRDVRSMVARGKFGAVEDDIFGPSDARSTPMPGRSNEVDDDIFG